MSKRDEFNSAESKVVTLRAVNRISPHTFNEIMTGHYPLAKPSLDNKRGGYSDSNIGRYLNTTARHGTRIVAIEEILTASRRSTHDEGDADLVLPMQKEPICAEITSRLCEYGSAEYLDELECNTTRNCISEIDLLDSETSTEYEVLPIADGAADHPCSISDNEFTLENTCVRNAEPETRVSTNLEMCIPSEVATEIQEYTSAAAAVIFDD